jgi:glutaredoxin-related protein
MTETTIHKSAKVFETGHCPRFDARTLDQKEVEWHYKLFVKGHVVSFWHMPINYGRVMVKLDEKIAKASANLKNPLMLTDEKSAWGADLYVEVTHEVPELENVRLNGTYLVRAFQGGYRKVPEFIAAAHRYVVSKGKTVQKFLFYYPYCPECAKAYDENYVVIFAKVG